MTSGHRSASLRAHTDGFSLVELSIVLVILGLLTGGILTGQNLIRAAELRSVTTEYAAYVTAVRTFQDKYFALPGDMTNATAFWGAMTNCGVASPSGTGTQTCNGNGDGKVDVATANGRTAEMFGFWQQLANAGLVEGQYTGIDGNGSPWHTSIGGNVPASRLGNGGWTAQWLGVAQADTWMFDGSFGNVISLGTQKPSSWTEWPIISPEEMWNVDKKIDDGKPETGRLIARKYLAGTGATHCSNTSTHEYSLQNVGNLCVLHFVNAF